MLFGPKTVDEVLRPLKKLVDTLDEFAVCNTIEADNKSVEAGRLITQAEILKDEAAKARTAATRISALFG